MPPASQSEPTLDLHGCRVDEARRRTAAFLVAEQARGTDSVRLVTGHGSGALKQAIGAFVRTHPAVARVHTSLRTDAELLLVLSPPRR